MMGECILPLVPCLLEHYVIMHYSTGPAVPLLSSYILFSMHFLHWLLRNKKIRDLPIVVICGSPNESDC